MIGPAATAGAWGLFAGAALLLGAAAGYYAALPRRLIAGIMAFGSGVLLSAVSFELVAEAYELDGLDHTAAGLVLGGLLFTVANLGLAAWGARHRKRSDPAAADGMAENGPAIAVGSLIDGIPESIAIGLTLLGGAGVSYATVVAIFLSNVPEGLSSSAGLRARGWRARSVFLLWAGIALASGAASLAGFVLFEDLGTGVRAVTLALAAGGILAMLADTMVPEAFSEGHNLSGVMTVLGFVLSFLLSKWP